MNPKFFDHIQRRFECFPDNYIVVDIETNGRCKIDTSPYFRKLILEIAYITVINRKIYAKYSALLRWPRHKDLSDIWLQGHLKHLERFQNQQRRRRRKRPFEFTYERLEKEGVPPKDVMEHCRSIFVDAQKGRVPFVVFNGRVFDCPVIESNIRDLSKRQFDFNPDDTIDIGLLTKGSESGLFPWPEEDISEYYERLEKHQSKQRWSLQNFCVPKYSLFSALTPQQIKPHTALFDCYITHLLLEVYRKHYIAYLQRRGKPWPKFIKPQTQMTFRSSLAGRLSLCSA